MATTKKIKIVLTKVGTAWDSTKQYKLHDYIVIDNAVMYICKRVDADTMVNVGHALTESDWWDKSIDLSEVEGKAETAVNKVSEAATKVTKYLDIVKLPVVETPSSESALAMDANKVYDITIGDALTITLNAPTDTTVTNEYQGSFDTGATAPTVTWPANVVWAATPTVEVSNHYEFSIRYVGGKYYGLIYSWTLSE